MPAWSLRFSALLLLSQGLSAQNLVPNGSFEDYRVCPGSYSQHPLEFRANEWRPFSWGTPDYFNSCSRGGAAVPYNWAGVSDAYDGFGYAGIYVWLGLKDFREYLHCKLSEPLVRDSSYHISFRYKLSSYSKFSADRIAFLISDSIASPNNDRPLKIPASVEFVKDSALTPETGSWELASTIYKARGGEQFLTIGNFSNNGSTRTYHIQFRPEQEPMLANAAYYYIDDVRVEPQFVSPYPTEPLPSFTGVDPELNTTYVLKNIQFAFNSYLLLAESYFDLDKVLEVLRRNPDLTVELAGHTDDVGEEGYNLELSVNRAKSAAGYLVAKGIARDRIRTVGYGESRPLVQPTTQAARDINRRVEITFHR